MPPKDSALRRKQSSIEPPAIRTPAIAGPVMREVWMRTLCRPTALTTLSVPTISITKDWRAGRSTARTIPRASTSAITIQAATLSVTERPKRTSGGIAISACVRISRRRLGTESATRPPQAPTRRIGQELKGGGDADGERRARQREDQPHLGDDLHPVARDRDELSAEPPAVVRDLEGADCSLQRGRHEGSSSMRSSTSAARSSVSTSSSPSLRRRRDM